MIDPGKRVLLQELGLLGLQAGRIGLEYLVHHTMEGIVGLVRKTVAVIKDVLEVSEIGERLDKDGNLIACFEGDLHDLGSKVQRIVEL